MTVSTETLNPHDSEEQLRPYLGRVYDAEEEFHTRGGIASLLRLRDAHHEALTKALELLSVPTMTSPTKETR